MSLLSSKNAGIGQKRPNILFVLLDTCRSDRLSCYGYPKPTSPNIDRLAGESLLFENAFASAPWTLPSHASIFTGLYPCEHRADDDTLFLNDSIPTLAQLLTDCGYRTYALANENNWLDKPTNIFRGFQVARGPVSLAPSKNRLIGKLRWKSYQFHQWLKPPSVAGIETLISLLKEPSDKPLFFFLNLMDAHMPYRPVEKFIRKFGLTGADRPMIRYLQDNFNLYLSKPESLSSEQMGILRKLYDGCIATLDSRLQRLFDVAGTPQFKDNTVTILTGDHGECIGEHNLLNHWLSLYDVLLKVPLIVSAPEQLIPRRRVAAPIQQQDLFYTILQLAGYQGPEISPEKILKHSLIEQACGRSPFPGFIFAEHAIPTMNLEHIRRYDPSFSNRLLEQPKRTARTDRWKLIRFGDIHEELFDVLADPGETVNLIDKYPDVAAMLRQAIAEHLAGTPQGDPSAHRPDFDPLIVQKLRDLGYM